MKDGAVAMATARGPYWSKADCITDAVLLELLLTTLPKFETLAPSIDAVYLQAFL